MREIRLHGSEGGGAETNRSFLPLSCSRPTSHALRSLGSPSLARGAGSSTPYPAGGQYATTCYVFRFWQKFSEPSFRRKLL